jgi:hypothetical protein
MAGKKKDGIEACEKEDLHVKDRFVLDTAHRIAKDNTHFALEYYLGSPFFYFWRLVNRFLVC